MVLRMTAYRGKVAEGGRVVIPAEIRRQLGFRPGVEVVLDVANGELRIRSVRQAVEGAQAARLE
jgi:AbrB family looped-hinge helix DNA binding protein